MSGKEIIQNDKNHFVGDMYIQKSFFQLDFFITLMKSEMKEYLHVAGDLIQCLPTL